MRNENTNDAAMNPSTNFGNRDQITLMLGREFSGMTYPQVGVPDAHHPVTHHRGGHLSRRLDPRVEPFAVRRDRQHAPTRSGEAARHDGRRDGVDADTPVVAERLERVVGDRRDHVEGRIRGGLPAGDRSVHPQRPHPLVAAEHLGDPLEQGRIPGWQGGDPPGQLL